MGGLTNVERADLAATEATAAARHTAIVRALGWLSEIADQPQLISICAATAVVGVLSRNGRLTTTGIRMLAGELLATKLKSAVKHRIDRTRPHVSADGGSYRMERGSDDDSAMNSFPSGHTAGAVAVSLALVRGYPELKAAAYSTAAAIAAIQVPRCKHYPSDLAAGAALGVVADGIVRAAGAAARRVTVRWNAD